MEELRVGQRITLLHDYYTSGIRYDGYLSLWYELYASGCWKMYPGLSFRQSENVEKKRRIRARKGETFVITNLIMHPREQRLLEYGGRPSRNWDGSKKRVYTPVIRTRWDEYIIMSDSLSAFEVVQ